MQCIVTLTTYCLFLHLVELTNLILGKRLQTVSNLTLPLSPSSALKWYYFCARCHKASLIPFQLFNESTNRMEEISMSAEKVNENCHSFMLNL